jgi:hypothetical protein
MRDQGGKPAMQAAVLIGRSRMYRGFAQASVPRMAVASASSEEFEGLKLLRRLCRDEGLMTLRLQPFRLGEQELNEFEARARDAGFERAPAIDVTRTLLMDLRPTPDELLAGFSKSHRQRIRHRGRNECRIVRLEDTSLIPRCREAEAASRSRTTGGTSGYDFDSLFALARRYPDRAFTLGLFLNESPDELLAFVTAVRHGKIAEYQAAGSFHNPALRSIPFNSFLLWDLILWARENGAEDLDLGGVTPGGPDDKLAGISEFKRHFTERELEVGREMLTVLKPAHCAAFRALHGLRGALASR